VSGRACPSLSELVQDSDLEWLFVDSTVVRAHQHAAGMNTGGEDQDLGRRVGGFSTKLHMAVDSLGNPVAMELSPGQSHDSKHALDVIGDLRPELVAMDKAYDSQPLMDELRSRGIEPCIPPKKTGRIRTSTTVTCIRAARASSGPSAC